MLDVVRKFNVVHVTGALRISNVIIANYARDFLSMLKGREETCRSTNRTWLDQHDLDH